MADNPPQLLNGRYALTNVVRSGGMATVTRAFDTLHHCFVAIKRMKLGVDSRRQNESFQRDVEALQALRHENIVEFRDFGKDSDGSPFLVMEWLNQNLHEYIMVNGALTWRQFIDQVGFPLLRAIEFAQKKKRVHRDIKPRNVLMTDDGTPKLTDYGISKDLTGSDSWLPVAGSTFRNDRTRGFSPPDSYDDRFAYGADCFSFAAVAVFCLTQFPIETDEDLKTALQEAAFPSVVKPLIERCLSSKSDEWPPMATVLLAEVERVEASYTASKEATLTFSLDLTATALDVIQRLVDVTGRSEVERFILQDIDETVAFVSRFGDGKLDDSLSVVGSTWRFGVRVGGRRNERLEIFEAFELGAARALELREGAYRPKVKFTFSQPRDAASSAALIRVAFDEVKQAQKLQEAARQAVEKGRVFRTWRSFLRDRADLEARRENSIRFIDRRIGGNTVTLTAEIAPSTEIIGQERLVRLSSGYIAGLVRNVAVDQITFEVEVGDASRLPQRGDLQFNTIAAQRALEHQYAALDAVVYDRGVNSRLKDLVADPTIVQTPIELERVTAKDPKLDAEKVDVLRRALGEFELLAIEGPPGTGKTSLIAEIIVQWLEAHPHHRILLASQTHIALDNVLDRIAELGAMPDVVRIGRAEDPRIADSAKPFILEHKVERWIAQVRMNAEAAMAKWADTHGVDRNAVMVGMEVELLIRILKQKQEISAAITKQRTDRELVSREPEKPSTDERQLLEAENLTIDEDLRTLKEAEAKLSRTEAETRKRLRALGEYGESLADTDDIQELGEWQGIFLTDDRSVKDCRVRLALLDDWLLRVGRSSDFNAAMLASAQVIAGTCVGVATVRGMQAVEYDLCIIDEASKATATESLIPMSRSRRWIVVGDPKQLPPFFEEFGEQLTNDFDESEIRQTLLDRFLDKEIGLPPACRVELRRQHRMIEPIGRLVSECFYDGRLISPITSHGLDLRPSLPGPVVWYTTANLTTREERPVGKTFENRQEIEVVRQVLSKLQFVASGRGTRISVAVITGYTAQVKALQSMVTRSPLDWPDLDISCNSVDAFQGRQADVCIYSVVRSNDEGMLGFLRERPRLNVALSRGKSGLVIVGDHLFCRNTRGDNPFRDVIAHIERDPKTYYLEDA
jgi:serine/threonine protein kinase